MDIELGIQNVARPVNFSTDESADNVSQAIAQAVADSVTEAIESALSAGTPIKLTDDKGRRIIVPAKALGYAIIGSETKHAVGFGTL